MAFSNYSDLFTSGLLSETYPPAFTSHPWATEDLGPRRGSLPGTVNSIVPIPSPPPTARVDSMAASGESFYFTFKKRRNPVDYRSFLSLDLAESQSLRSASLKGRDGRSEASSSRRHLHRAPASWLTSPTRSSFNAVHTPPPPPRSPPASSSPPRLSRLHVPTPVRPVRHPLPTVPSISSPSGSSASSAPKLPSVETSTFKFPSKSPLLSPTFLVSPTTQTTSPISPVSKGGLSPMRFASPPPSPPMDTDSIGPMSYATSSVSSTFRKAQRGDALARLEGRGRSEARGSRRNRNAFPRVSQNFMSMSDDEDEEELVDAQLELEVVPEDHGEEMQQRISDTDVDLGNAMDEQDRYADAQGLVVSIDAAALTLFNLTPRTSTRALAWSQFLDSPQPKAKTASRTSLLAEAVPRSKSAISHSHSRRTENHPSVTNGESRSSKRHRTSHPPRLSLNLDPGWAPVEVNFIDLRDEQQDDTHSGSDSWRSIFEVSCPA